MCWKVNAEMVFPKSGADERQNASDYLSNTLTWCMKDGALSVDLIKAK